MTSRKQFWILFAVTLVFVGPHLLLHGTNIVTKTYELAAERFAAGSSPYANAEGIADQFKYSPFFSQMYHPLSLLPSRGQAFVWGVLGIFVFWLGIVLWFPMKKEGVESSLVLGLILASMELDGALRYQQINPLIVGGILIAAHGYRKRQWLFSGFLLALLADIKVFPILFALILARPFRLRYSLGLFLGLFFAYWLPAQSVGWAANHAWHREWVAVLMKDAGSPGILDLNSALTKVGIALPRWIVPTLLSLFTLPILLRRRRESGELGINLSLGLLYLLLISPRTESPTFVLVAPCYLFLLTAIIEVPLGQRVVPILLYGLGAFLITVSMNDVWPRWIWNPTSFHQMNKTLGVFLLWVCGWLLAVQRRETTAPIPASRAALSH